MVDVSCVPEKKLYVITRRDLAPSVRAVMALHVTANIARVLGVPDEDWTQHGPPIVLMTVRNRYRLERLAFTQHVHPYSDPDLNDGVCAIAIYEYEWSHQWARLAQFGDL